MLYISLLITKTLYKVKKYPILRWYRCTSQWVSEEFKIFNVLEEENIIFKFALLQFISRCWDPITKNTFVNEIIDDRWLHGDLQTTLLRNILYKNGSTNVDAVPVLMDSLVIRKNMSIYDSRLNRLLSFQFSC